MVARSNMTTVLLAGLLMAVLCPVTAAQSVANGRFDDAGGWELSVRPGAVGRFTIDADPRLGTGSCARVQVEEHASFTGWEIALVTEAEMAGGRRYRVGFSTASAEPGHVEVCVQSAESPFDILHLAAFDCGAAPRTYEFLTGPVPEDGTMRIAFWFGNSPTGTYWLDGISAEPLTDEETAALALAPEGFENGDFSAGEQGWELRVHDAARATFTVDPEPKLGDGNCARIDVTNATDTSWHVQFMQIFKVVEGKQYVATFSAVADRDVEITVSYQIPPPDNTGVGSGRVKLTTVPQTFSVTSARTERASEMKLSFHLSGVGAGTFWVDKVSVAVLHRDD